MLSLTNMDFKVSIRMLKFSRALFAIVIMVVPCALRSNFWELLVGHVASYASIPGNAADERLQRLQEFLSGKTDSHYRQGGCDQVLNQTLVPDPQVSKETQLPRGQYNNL